MLRSMTAYVSTNHIYKGCSISCDIKSVNGKYLDINFKSNFILPEVELVIRELISKKVQRGNLEINFNAETIEQSPFTLNKKLIKEIKEELNKSDLDIKNLNFSDIKDIPDIFMDKKKSSFSGNIIKKVFKEALKALIENKEIEGQKIKKTFTDRIKRIHKNLISLANEVENNKLKRKKNILNQIFKQISGMVIQILMQFVECYTNLSVNLKKIFSLFFRTEFQCLTLKILY